MPLWPNAAIVANYTHSYRAPALEELYNNGPHPGNATFKIGNPKLQREHSASLDLALRFQQKGLHAEANFFYYSIDDFVFLAPTGHVRDGLITPAGTPLPRIPPLRGRFGLDLHLQNLSLRPEAVAVHSQNRFFPTRTRTAGSVIFNFNASYTIAGQHAIQIFSVSAFNLDNQLYRNHLSFIKDIAPEVGGGIRLAYTVRFF